jgi:hypothetical protein
VSYELARALEKIADAINSAGKSYQEGKRVEAQAAVKVAEINTERSA